MAYPDRDITTFISDAKTDLFNLMKEILDHERLGEKEEVNKKVLQARVVSAGILALDNYEDYTQDEKSRLIDIFSNYEELTQGNC
jgi:hypothetical protein